MRTVSMQSRGKTGRISVVWAGLLCIIIGICTACASAPVKHVSGYTPAIGEEAARTALSMVNRPYRYRGENPEGFDCSGLVRYSYRSAGLDAPHGTEQLVRVSISVGLNNIRKGDLLFFIENGRPFSHVGISIGNKEFVHAPSSGRSVCVSSLDEPYWNKRFLDARRLL